MNSPAIQVGEAGKPVIEHDEAPKGAPVSEAEIGRSMGFSDEDQQRIKRRIDRRLIPIVGLMYCVSLVDRTNVAAASVAGMLEDLRLIGNRYVCAGYYCCFVRALC
ncbi:hypothetical protein ASPCAL13407 [Aspergillus calidoustus]|uniref:Uncharacterized protein n=1 Tax=Aspergillus calidoustus TaxID=454130 RepID=A0A0U5GHL0_ASPCI|nr:hypothetical protein ASPCAL13407 [Aspergillus calidoustus]